MRRALRIVLTVTLVTWFGLASKRRGAGCGDPPERTTAGAPTGRASLATAVGPVTSSLMTAALGGMSVSPDSRQDPQGSHQHRGTRHTPSYTDEDLGPPVQPEAHDMGESTPANSGCSAPFPPVATHWVPPASGLPIITDGGPDAPIPDGSTVQAGGAGDASVGDAAAPRVHPPGVPLALFTAGPPFVRAIGKHPAAGVSPEEAAACDAHLGGLAGNHVANASLPARKSVDVPLSLAPGGTYLLIVNGVFTVSTTTCQDAIARWPCAWDSPFLCLTCEANPLYRDVTLSINDEVVAPMRSCPMLHRYGYLVSAPAGQLVLRLRDWRYGNEEGTYEDNDGQLTADVYRLGSPPEVHAAEEEPPGQRLGIPVGRPLGGVIVFGLGRREQRWSFGPTRILVEVSGWLSPRPGIKLDAGYVWNVQKGTVNAAERDALLEANCESVDEIAEDPGAHRYLFVAQSCLDPLTIRLRPAVKQAGSIVRLRLWAAP